MLFAVSGLASAAMGALLAGALAGAFLAGPIGLVFGFVGGVGGILPAIGFAALPAMVLGGALWTANSRRQWARNRWVWSGIGAGIGLVSLGLSFVIEVAALAALQEDLALSDLVIAFAVAGAGAALMFHETMRFLLDFCPADDAG